MANNLADLLDGPALPINCDEFAATVNSNGPWTGTTSSGGTNAGCETWSTNDPTLEGGVGDFTSTSGTWTEIGDGGGIRSCGDPRPLYCIEQPSPETCGNGMIDDGETCEDGNLVNGDGCSSTCRTEPCGTDGCTVFVTSQIQSAGLFGSLEGADSLCNVFAAQANLPQYYKAWLGRPATNAPSRLDPSSGPFIRTCGGTVAQSIGDLLDGQIENPINCTQTGVMLMSSIGVWTGTKASGQANDDCLGWTSNSGAFLGGSGDSSSTSGSWTELGDGGGVRACSDQRGLYCMEQAPPPECSDGILQPGEDCDDGNDDDGDCCSSSCHYETVGSACASDGSPCTTDLCDGAGTCEYTAGNAGAVCRAAAGVCDVGETCSGTSATCPGNIFAPSTLPCRASAGICDAGESCTGSGAACPANVFVSSATTCRAAAGICDAAEKCSGSGASCPADVFAASTTTCRATAGVCDAAESCSGTSATCPGNVFASSSTTCRAVAGICDVAEVCSGTGAVCSSNAFAPSSTACRPSAGICDLVENCSGTGAACLANSFAPSTTLCRASAGICDAGESCTGSSASCPANGFASSATTCRAAAGICDAAEKCTGSSLSCPADIFVASATTCRATAGVCDAAESCSGSSEACPSDAFASSSTACRAIAGICDRAETCSGSGASCPADDFLASTTPCRGSAGICDAGDSCSGSSASCPANGFASSATTCREAADSCDVAEKCTGSSLSCPDDIFVASATTCRGTAGVCDAAESCSGSSAVCPVDAFASSSTACRAVTGICDLAEHCSGTSATCPADRFTSSSTACRVSAGICDLAENCSGSSGACPADDFVGSTTPCRVSAGVCDTGESCSGSSASCPADVFASPAASCRAAAGMCDLAETCSGSSATCPANAFATSTVTCRATSGTCDVAESCPGSASACPADSRKESGTPCGDPANGDCDLADTCDGAGNCELNRAPNGSTCDDGNVCTTDQCAAGVCETQGIPNCPLLPEDPSAGDQFGAATALSSKYLVVGAPASKSESSGRVHVFLNTEVGYADHPPQTSPIPLPFEDSDHATGDLDFGASVDVDGSTIVVGAPFDVVAVGDNQSSGSASVFFFDGSVWLLQEKLVDSGGLCTRFGTDVAISGNTVVVGAPGGDCALVFQRSGTQWTLAAGLNGSDPGSQFGQSVDISGDSILVGSPGNSSESGCDAMGVVEVFRRDGSTWSHEDTIEEPEGSGGGACFGAAVAVDGDTGAIGAPFDDSAAPGAGAVYVIEHDAEEWPITTQLLAFPVPSQDQQFGASVDLRGYGIIVGAPGVAAYLFERSDDPSPAGIEPDSSFRVSVVSWLSRRRFVPPPEAPADEGRFAKTVSMSTTGVVIGAPLEDAGVLKDTGAVYPGDTVLFSAEVCGNLIVTAGEDCDDGDVVWATGEPCNAQCKALACGDSNDDGRITAPDALFTLRAAVGAARCDVSVCDVDASESISAADALRVLQKAVGQTVTLSCL